MNDIYTGLIPLKFKFKLNSSTKHHNAFQFS